MKKNILFVTTSFPRWKNGTAGVFILNLGKSLNNFFKIIISAPQFEKIKLKEEMDGLLIYRFRYFWPFFGQKICYEDGILSKIKHNKILILILPFLLLFQFVNVLYLIRKEKIDLIHAHWFFPSGFTAGLAAKILKKPLVVTAHGSDLLILKNKFWNLARSLIFKMADSITVVNPKLFAELKDNQRIDFKKINCISMGVDINQFSYQRNLEKKDTLINNLSRPILLYVGILSKFKGLDYLIKALPAIIEKFPQTNLVMIGLGQDKEELEKLALNLNLKEKVFFLGSLPNEELPAYYQKADVFVLPSLSEGTPVTILEAMASGCPVVATEAGGIPYLIKNGENGLLVKPQSSQELSRAIIEILSKPDLRDKFIKKAREIVEDNYDWQIIANKHKLLYESLIKNNKR